MRPRLTFRKGYWRVNPFPYKLARGRSALKDLSLLSLYNRAHEWACRANNKIRARNALSNPATLGSCEQQRESQHQHYCPTNGTGNSGPPA